MLGIIIISFLEKIKNNSWEKMAKKLAQSKAEKYQERKKNTKTTHTHTQVKEKTFVLSLETISLYGFSNLFNIVIYMAILLSNYIT